MYADTAVPFERRGDASRRLFDRRVAATLTAILLTIALFDVARTVVEYRVTGETLPGWGYLGFKGVPWLAWIPIVPVLLVLSRIAPIERLGRWTALGIYGLTTALLTVLHAGLTAAVRGAMAPVPPYNRFSTQFLWLFPEYLAVGMAVCGGLVAAAWAMDYRRRLRSVARAGTGSSAAVPASSASGSYGAAVANGSAAVAPGARHAANGDSSSAWLTRLTVRTRDRIRLVPIESVEWVKADGNYIRVRAEGEVHRIRATLSSTLEALDPEVFVRIHRSTVVNVNRIRELEPWFNGDYLVVLNSGEKLKVSRRYRTELF